MIRRVELIPLDAKHDSYGPFDNLRRFTFDSYQFIGQWKDGKQVWIQLKGKYVLSYQTIKKDKV